MIKNILVPTDYSQNARKAVKFGIELAKKTGAKLTFINTYFVPNYILNAPVDSIAEETLKQEANFNMEAFKKEHLSETLNIPFDCLIRTGDTVVEIVKAANEVDADIIIMGTKGASGITEVMFGSNTEAVIEKTNIPVMVIPMEAQEVEFKNILFATNYHLNDFNALEELVAFAKLYDATITVLHIDDGEMIRDFEYTMLDSFHLQVKERIDYPKFHFQLMENKNVFEGLQDFIHKNKIDLIALSSRKKALYDRLFGKSISKKMAYHTDIPLLVFKISEENEIIRF